MIPKFYTGVGSRRTPVAVLSIMSRLANKLATEGWILRSGHAAGADQAFERGAGGRAQIFLPWSGFEGTVRVRSIQTLSGPSKTAFWLTALLHPAFDLLDLRSLKLHARNVHQVLGECCYDPSRFLVCWTPGGREVGGTAQAIRLARCFGVEVFNLADESTMRRIRRKID